MKEILSNSINHTITSQAKGDRHHMQEMISLIRETVFPSMAKKWTRILNNTSQPDLQEAAAIAECLNTTIDDLFTFSEIKIKEAV